MYNGSFPIDQMGNDQSQNKFNEIKSDQQEQLFKIVIIGDQRVGKTTFIKQLVHNIYSPNYTKTIGADISTITIRSKKSNTIFGFSYGILVDQNYMQKKIEIILEKLGLYYL